MTAKSQRTNQQNRAAHKYFSMVAAEAGEKGITAKVFLDSLREHGEVPVTPELVKSCWKGVQEQMLGKNSTTQLTTEEVSLIYGGFSMALSMSLGLSTPFPSQWGESLEQAS